MVSANNMVSPIPNWRKEEAYPVNGWDKSAHPANFYGMRRTDIADKGMREDVHDFVSETVNFSQQRRKDIGEGGIDAEVHGMASANNMVSPIPNWRKETAYPPNGWDPKAHPADFVGVRRTDIADKDMREDVHNLASEAVNFSQRDEMKPQKKKDIGEGGIDAEVHGMASANNMVSPIPNWRKETAYPPNGWDAKAHPSDFHMQRYDVNPEGISSDANRIVNEALNFSQKPQAKKDIGEGGIDAEVHGMASANNMVSPIPNWRKEEAYPANGWDPKAHPSDFLSSFKNANLRDIANKEVRPDVYKVVFDNVSPWPNHRSKDAPKEFEHPWDKEEHLVEEAKKQEAWEWGRMNEYLERKKKEDEEEEEAKEAKLEAAKKKSEEYHKAQEKKLEEAANKKKDDKAEDKKEDKKDDKKADKKDDKKKEEGKKEEKKGEEKKDAAPKKEEGKKEEPKKEEAKKDAAPKKEEKKEEKKAAPAAKKPVAKVQVEAPKSQPVQ